MFDTCSEAIAGESPLVGCDSEGERLWVDLDLAYSLYGSLVVKCDKLDNRLIGIGSFADLYFSITALIASCGYNVDWAFCMVTVSS